MTKQSIHVPDIVTVLITINKIGTESIFHHAEKH